MKAYTRRRLLASMKMGLATIPFVLAFRALSGGFLPGAVVLGFGLGFAVGVAELFVLRDWFRHLPFGVHLLVKSLTLMGVMGLAFALLNLLDVFIEGVTWREYVTDLFRWGTLVGLLQMLLVIAFLLFFVHLDRLLGPGVLLGYVTGRFHQPRREERVFMFLDLQGSTTLADQMPPDRYFRFLHRYFTEISEPILESEAEIYQYVGDEVVLTWTRERALEEANCVRAFFLILDRVQARRGDFLRDFGTVPTFKAGVHGGEVITAQIGELKREIVHSGDVLNTAARIQAKCNELGRSLLVSAELFESLELGSGYRGHHLGGIELRGKGEPVELVAVERSGR